MGCNNIITEGDNMDNLKKLREEKHMSQVKLAMRINASQSTVSFYETGERVPDANVLIELAQIFECSVDYLLGRSKIKYTADQLAMEELSPVEAGLIFTFSRLSSEKQNKLLGTSPLWRRRCNRTRGAASPEAAGGKAPPAV